VAAPPPLPRRLPIADALLLAVVLLAVVMATLAATIFG
jgi:hypothetical protein